MSLLKEKLAAKIPPMRETVKALLDEHGDRPISQVTIAQAYGSVLERGATVFLPR